MFPAFRLNEAAAAWSCSIRAGNNDTEVPDLVLTPPQTHTYCTARTNQSTAAHYRGDGYNLVLLYLDGTLRSLKS